MAKSFCPKRTCAESLRSRVQEMINSKTFETKLVETSRSTRFLNEWLENLNEEKMLALNALSAT